jgi:hypothetical protein
MHRTKHGTRVYPLKLERKAMVLCWTHNTRKREASMRREDEYRQLANDVLRRASGERSAQLRAQWEILGARYMELADQSKKITPDTEYDPIPWERRKDS